MTPAVLVVGICMSNLSFFSFSLLRCINLLRKKAEVFSGSAGSLKSFFGIFLFPPSLTENDSLT